ncbi:MAG: hypoxanthine phosphoribosyltransferase [Candidatus Hydrogenedentes bacterium]|nr:hypoxanthine phosphoribosyltransferase [Candidatus Hydrogenedentota bacterium]
MRLNPEPLISPERIAARVGEMAAQIRADYAGRRPLLLCVLKGAAFFTADLARALAMDTDLEFVRARSYVGTRSGGEVSLSRMDDLKITGRHVLLIEDIVDTGRTLSRLCGRLRDCEPASLALVTLLDKPGRREVPMRADYTGFEIGNQFVVGYGLDYEEQYRQLPGVYLLEED